ncbi:multiheme c-type cytochrome [Hydrogenimonas sp.]
MPRSLLTLLFFISLLPASENFVSSKICRGCHPLIYKEYYGSMHRRSSIYNDPVHNAVWQKHPLRQKGRYNCAPCHSPSDTKLMEALEAKKTALPEPNDIQKEEPIGCSYCHRIEAVIPGKKANRNLIAPKSRTYFAAKGGKSENSVIRYHKEEAMMGLSKRGSGSPFHTIDYSNSGFSSGKMCIGCHAFKKNSHGLSVCSMDLERSKKGERNCITCHMPKIKGAKSTLSAEGTHTYHGFSGLHNRPELLAKSVKLTVQKANGKLMVTLENEADHTLFAHPLRLAQLRVEIQRGSETLKIDPVDFYTTLGKDGRPAMPWTADSILESNRIEAHETVHFPFDVPLQENDRVTVTLGYFIVNPKAAVRLGLSDSDSTEFTVLKRVRFTF